MPPILLGPPTRESFRAGFSWAILNTSVSCFARSERPEPPVQLIAANVTIFRQLRVQSCSGSREFGRSAKATVRRAVQLPSSTWTGTRAWTPSFAGCQQLK
jgi:hypothetical protein